MGPGPYTSFNLRPIQLQAIPVLKGLCKPSKGEDQFWPYGILGTTQAMKLSGPLLITYQG